MTTIRSFTNSNDLNINTQNDFNNKKSKGNVDNKTEEKDKYIDEYVSSSDTSTQPMIFSEGTSQKMKAVLNSYDANSVFASGILNQSQPPVFVTTKKFLPDGSVEITTRKDGQVVDRSRKKPHMVSVRDPITNKIKQEPFISIFDPDFM